MNEKKSTKNKAHKVHLLGICGISMSALAIQLQEFGFEVSGSDRNLRGQVYKILTKKGIAINDRRGLEESETVVFSSAIPPDDEKFLYAKQSGKNLISRAQLLNEIAKGYKAFIGVSGTHGKTTTTSLISHVAQQAGWAFSSHLGGLDANFGNYYGGGKDWFIAELCEYKKNISHFSPDFSVLLNVDNDHLESYGSLQSIREEFLGFARRSGVCVCSGEVGFTGLKNVVSFSLKNQNCDFFAKVITNGKKMTECAVYEHRAPLLSFDMSKFMPHDANNLLATVALFRTLGVSAQTILDGVKNFGGVARRNEVIFQRGNSLIIADYAHHPKQLELAIKGYNKRYGKCIFLFQPHTYSRTKLLFEDFVRALSNCNELYLFKTYGARESYDYEGSGFRLCQSVKGGKFIGDASQVESLVNGLIARDLPIIVLGAGDLYDHLLDAVKGL